MSLKYTIIVRIYNAEKYLRQCIESVLNQTYNNWELVLVDDGSKDSSLSICNEFAKKNSRIVVVSQENKGGLQAQITGFKYATGDYICGLDSDDWYDNNLLEKCNSYVEENKDIDVLIFGYRCIYENNSSSVFSMTEQNQILNKKGLVDFVLNHTAHALWFKVFKKQTVFYTDFENQLFEANANVFRSNNDLVLGYPHLFNANKALICKDLLYNYRVLSDSISHKRIPYKRINVSLHSMDYLYAISKEKNGLSDDLDFLIVKEIYREILPEIYLIFRYLKINLKEIKAVKSNTSYKMLINSPYRKKIMEAYGPRYKTAFFIFNKIL